MVCHGHKPYISHTLAQANYGDLQAIHNGAAKGCITQHLRASPEKMAMEMPSLGYTAEVHLLTHQSSSILAVGLFSIQS